MINNLKKDYFWNTLGSTASSFLSFALTVIITRINGIDDSGLYTFVFGMVSIFMMISFFGGRNYQITDTKNEFKSREYIVLRILASITTIFVTAIFVLFNRYDFYTTIFLFSLLLYKILDSLCDVIGGVMQKNGRLYINARSQFIKTIIGVGGFVIIDLLTHNILISSLSLVVVTIVGMLCYDIPQMQKVEEIDFKKESITAYLVDSKKIVKATYLLMVIGFLQMILINILRYFMQIFHPNLQGYLGIIIMPSFFISLLSLFIIVPQMTILAQFFNAKNLKEFTKIIRKMLLGTLVIGIIILIVAYFLAIPALNIVFGVELSPYKNQLLIMIFGGILYCISTIFFTSFTVMRKLKQQAIILSFCVLLEALLVVVLINNFAILGATISYAGVNFVQIIICYLVYRFTIKAES